MVKTADEIRRINSADLRSLTLILNEDSDMEDLTEAITELESVKRVVISCADEDEPPWGLGELEALFVAIGQLPKLQTLKLKHVGYDEENPFCITLLTDLLFGNADHSSIQGIHLQDCGLLNDGGQFREYAEFAERLKGQSQLKRFKVESCSISDDPTDACLAMNYIVDALSYLPNVIDVAFEVEEEEGELGKLESEALSRLCRSRTLHTLRLDGFELNDECLVSVADALKSSPSIKKLNMDFYGDTKQGCKAFAEMLQVNESLEQIRFEAGYDFNVLGFLFDIADALTINTSIKDATFYGFDEIISSGGGGGELAFAKMLEVNDVLQGLVLSGDAGHYSGEYRPTIDFYLRLNKRGRRQLAEEFESTSRGDWIKVFADCSLDLDCLFYFLKMNPLLCGVPDATNMNANKKNHKGAPYTCVRIDELKHIRKMIDQLKVGTKKSFKLLEKQQESFTKQLENHQTMISQMKQKHEKEMADKDTQIQFLSTELQAIRSRMNRFEEFMNLQTTAEKAASSSRGTQARGKYGDQNEASVPKESRCHYQRINADLPLPLQTLWAHQVEFQKQPSLERILNRVGCDTNRVLAMLGLGSNCCGHYFIIGVCTNQNCRRVHHCSKERACTVGQAEVVAALVREAVST